MTALSDSSCSFTTNSMLVVMMMTLMNIEVVTIVMIYDQIDNTVMIMTSWMHVYQVQKACQSEL